MRIVVCIKEVPDTTEVKIDPERNTLIREGVPSIINPFDGYALEMGLKIKDELGAELLILSMGPSQVEENLRTAIARGADSAILLSDRAFAGADTLATSFTLSAAIRRIGDVDLILCGKQAIDGDTAQVGPGIAEFLGLPQVVAVTEITEVTNKKLVTKRITEGGYDLVELQYPALCTVTKGKNELRVPSIRGKLKAKKADIPIWDNEKLGLDERMVGLNGSPTWVTRVFTPPPKGEGKIWDEPCEESVTNLLKELKAKEVL